MQLWEEPGGQNALPVRAALPERQPTRWLLVGTLALPVLLVLALILLARPGRADRLTATMLSASNLSSQTLATPTWTPPSHPAPTRATYVVTILDTLYDLPAATVVEPVANLWASPEEAGEPDSLQTQLLMGERVIIKGETETGHWISAVDQPSSKDSHGYPGWIHKSTLVPGLAIADRYAVVMVPQAAVRAEPDAAAEVLTWLYLDTRLPGLEWDESWLRIRLPEGKAGWIDGSAVRTTQDLDLPAARAEVLDTATALLGTPYRWGGTTSGACDCSGFVFRVFHAHGITIARDSQDQAQGGGAAASRETLQPGDLIFTSQGDASLISHVAIFLGDDQMVDCGLNGVQLRSLNNLLQDRTWRGARTYLR